MKYWLLALALALPLAPVHADRALEGHPEARPFIESADAKRALADALQAAAVNGRKVIIIMGANWCHDSRALAGWFATPRFEQVLGRHYQVVYIDVGNPQLGKGRNLDIAKSFDIKKMRNTPVVLMLSADGRLLNSKKDAVSWRNAASRSEDEIYRYFADFRTDQK